MECKITLYSVCLLDHTKLRRLENLFNQSTLLPTILFHKASWIVLSSETMDEIDHKYTQRIEYGECMDWEIESR